MSDKKCNHKEYVYHDSDVVGVMCQCGAGRRVDYFMCVDCDAIGQLDVGIQLCVCNPDIKWEKALD